MTYVYHVANPMVPGTMIGSVGKDNYIEVEFLSPVKFSGNSFAEERTRWYCNVNLLFYSSEEAKKAHNPKKEEFKNKNSHNQNIINIDDFYHA